MTASATRVADVNGNRLLIVCGADAGRAVVSPSQFFDSFQYPSGFDSLVAVEPCGAYRLSMRVFERDGSESAFCGNGSLALAALIGQPAALHTPAGTVFLSASAYRASALIPRPYSVAAIHDEDGSYATCGEPHSLYRVGHISREDPYPLGPERNCTFIERISSQALRIRTFERGVDRETGSCGSGACAAVALLEEELDTHVRVEMPGGRLMITRTPAYFRVEADVYFDPTLFEQRI